MVSPHKDQIEELFIVVASLYVFPTRYNIVNFLVNLTAQHAYQRHDIAYFG